jgi:hypothetical protein
MYFVVFKGSQGAGYQLELRSEEGRALSRAGTAVRRTEKQLCGEDGSLQLDITEECRRVRVSFVGQMEEEEGKPTKNVVFVRIQAWFQVLYSPIRDWCIQ